MGIKVKWKNIYRKSKDNYYYVFNLETTHKEFCLQKNSNNILYLYVTEWFFLMTEEQIINIRCCIWYNCLLEIESNKQINKISSVQSLSLVWLFATPWTAALQASISITDSRSPPKPMSIESVMPSNHLILCRPLLLLSSIFPSIRLFSNESALPIRWPKYWSFSFNISPSNEHPGPISFRMDWLDLLAVQGTLKTLLQHNSSKASILQCSAFFIVHSHTHTWPLEKP